MRNAIRAYDLFSSLDPFKESDLLRAHGILMESFVDDAGKYRASGVGVFGETGMVHLAPPPGRVAGLMVMGDLFEWLGDSRGHLLIRSCVFHYEFIHPFVDGNGRTGRLWQSLILSRLHPLFAHLPVENMVFANQQAYYEAIAQSTKEGLSEPFILFMLSKILRSLKLHQGGRLNPQSVDNKMSNTQLVVLSLLKKDPYLTIAKIAERSSLSTATVKKALAALKVAKRISRVGSNKSGYWVVE